MKILKNKLFIIFCFIFLMIPSVKAETEYYDGEGNMFRLVFDDTPLRNFVKRDFAFVYDDLDNRGKTIALFEKPYRGYIEYAGYKIENDLLITIYETTQAYQNSTNIKYVVNITPEMMTSNSSSIMLPKNYIDNYVVLGDDGFYTIYAGTHMSKSSGSGLDFLNLEKSSYTTHKNYNVGWSQEAYGGVTLTVDTEGNVQRIYDIGNNYIDLVTEIRDNARRNIFYSSHDIYDKNKNLITPKEEFMPTRNTPYADYSLGCDENNPFIYNIYFNIDYLEKNDNVKIYKEDKLLKDVKYVYDPGETETLTIENAQSGYYKINVYDENNDLLYSATFHINVEIGDIFDENDTPVTLLDKIKIYLKGFKNNINMFYQGFENFFSSLNFELRTGIFIITTIFIIVYIIKIIL